MGVGDRLILAVDPGEVRIGLAISDPTGTIARPLQVLEHVSRPKNAAAISEIASENDVELIIVGLPLDDEGQVGPQARRSLRLAEELRKASEAEITLWDESESTRKAGSRDAMIDARAAAFILQDYLDSQARGSDPEG